MIRNKTYKNVMIIRNKLIKEKHYDPNTAIKLALQVFDNHEMQPEISVEWFYSKILTKEEFESQQAKEQG